MTILRAPKISDFTFLALAVGIVWGFTNMQESWRLQELSKAHATIVAAPVTDWFALNSVNVADSQVGMLKIPVVYNRVINKPFDGVWIAEIHSVPDNIDVCDGWGLNRYEPKDVLPTAGVDLNWLMGKHCDLKPGQYVVKVSVKVTTDEGVVKHTQVTSNIFKVTEASAAP